jgi:cytochrome P450
MTATAKRTAPEPAHEPTPEAPRSGRASGERMTFVAAKPTPVLPTWRPFGHLAELQRDPLGVFLRAFREVGDVARLRAGPFTVILLGHPELAQDVLIDNARAYTKGTRGYAILKLLLGEGLVTSEGEHWKRQRRIAQPAFHRRCIDDFAVKMTAIAGELVQEWREREDGMRIDAAAEMSRITLRIVSETLFSMDVSGESDTIGRALTQALEHFHVLTSSRLPMPERWPTRANRRFNEAVATMNGVVEGIIAERRASPEPVADLLGLLMAATDEETGEHMSDRHLRDEAFTMLMAGHETTANALTFTLHLLSHHPEAQERVHAEVVEVLGDEPLGAEHLSRLPYCWQVLQESMRLYPPAWILGRKAAEDTVVGEWQIPQGAFVYFSPYVIHRHPDFWDDPESFDPDRFDPERVAQWRAEGRPRLAYLPFSGGQRKCIGDQFARAEALALLAALLRDFAFEPIIGTAPALEASVTLRPKAGLPLRVRQRTAKRAGFGE